MTALSTVYEGTSRKLLKPDNHLNIFFNPIPKAQ